MAFQMTLKSYPNPVVDQLHLVHPQSGQFEQVVITDLRGSRQILPVYDNTVDVNRLAPGIYVMSVEDGGTLYRKRIVKR